MHGALTSACPVCGGRGIEYSHRLAAALDTLTPAQCRLCGKCATLRPHSLSCLGVPELAAGPAGVLAWLLTQDLRLAVQMGLLAYLVVFLLVARLAPLVVFVAEDEGRLPAKRRRLWRVAATVLAALMALTMFMPGEGWWS